MRYNHLAVLKQALERRRKLLELRMQGKSLQEIANLWGISRQRVAEIAARAKQDDPA